jgi:hypothetical protein
LFSLVDSDKLAIKPFGHSFKVNLGKPALQSRWEFSVPASELLEIITNYKYRHHWVEGVDRFEYDEDEVTRLGSEHACVISGKHLDFITVTKEVKPGQLVYGEMTKSPPPVDELYQFYIITPISESSCILETETHFRAKSPLKKLILNLLLKNEFRKNTVKSISSLQEYVHSKLGARVPHES